MNRSLWNCSAATLSRASQLSALSIIAEGPQRKNCHCSWEPGKLAASTCSPTRPLSPAQPSAGSLSTCTTRRLSEPCSASMSAWPGIVASVRLPRINTHSRRSPPSAMVLSMLSIGVTPIPAAIIAMRIRGSGLTRNRPHGPSR